MYMLFKSLIAITKRCRNGLQILEVQFHIQADTVCCLKYIFDETIADRVPELILDWTFMQQLPPSENSRSDSIDVGFTVMSVIVIRGHLSRNLGGTAMVLCQITVNGHLRHFPILHRSVFLAELAGNPGPVLLKSVKIPYPGIPGSKP